MKGWFEGEGMRGGFTGELHGAEGEGRELRQSLNPPFEPSFQRDVLTPHPLSKGVC